MTPESHARLQEIFEAAIELAPHARSAFLDRACDGDLDLRERVNLLIVAADDTDTVGGPLDEHPALVVRECPRCGRCFDAPLSACAIDGTALDHSFPGSLLIDGKYRIERRLGTGGMGAVYLAQHIGLEKYFAVKLIDVDGPVPAAYRERFEIEALALGRLKHPNIVGVTDFGIDRRGGGLPYLVMEYLEGSTVSQMIRDRKTLAFLDALELLRQVAEGVDAAHAKDIVHGDLKPSNLIVSGGVPRIVDFGLARLPSPGSPSSGSPAPDSERGTASGTIRGTPPYMAPELFRGEPASPSSDRFAFGVLAYEILSGEVPFGRRAWEVQKRQRQPAGIPSQRNPELPPEADAPVMALLNVNPGERPPSASAAVAAMERAWIAAEQRKWRRREMPRRLAMAGLVAAVAVLAASLSTRASFLKVLEERTVDWRFALLPARSPDPRLLAIAVDDRTLAENPSRSLAAMDSDFARMIDGLFAAGARAVAVDILLPNWSQSAAFARTVETHADRLVLARYSGASGVIGPECIGPLTANFLLGIQRYDTLFGFVNLDEDEDRRIRRGRVSFLDGNGHPAASFAELATEAAGFAERAPHNVFAIDYSVRARTIPVMSWMDALARLREGSAFFSGKLIVLGANYDASNDALRVPGAPALVPGAVVQTLIANTILERFPISQSGVLGSMLAVGLASFATIAAALRFPHRPAAPRALLPGLFFGYIVFSFLIFRSRLTLVAITAPEIAVILAALAAWRLPLHLAPYPTALRPEVTR